MEAHPEALVADSFPCPLALAQTGTMSEGSEEPLQGDKRALATIDSPIEGRGQKRKVVASSFEEGSSSSEEGSDSSSDSENEPAAKKQRATEASS